ncbi:MAG: glycosyltransferase family 4 protein [Anaerolineales bacterium]|nr:glycosyltransferase family 4 protein [Anaerolineales bacterium]
MLTTIHLTLFFTRDVSLRTWAGNGSLEREIALYLRLQREKGVQVSFITYGDRTDLQYRDQLQGIEILCNHWSLPPRIYERLIPVLHARALIRADLIKTNQANGADVALRAAHNWRKPLLARCGYMWSDTMQALGLDNEAERARAIERAVFTGARGVVVATPSMKEYVTKNYAISNERVHVIPNYVLTDVFSPEKTQPIPNRVCFIGRLSEEKNLFSLIQACAGLDVDLHFIGGGPLLAALQERARELHVQLTLHGNLSHYQLPAMIRQSAFFALVSTLGEWHPKSLLEAMSCGVAVLGADSPGIREQIVHGETGWLVGTDAASIRAGIQHLLANPSLREKLGANARGFILENYSLDKVVEMEYALYQGILNGTGT